MPSAKINQPSNQIRLTNVSLVRMKKGKKRFEVPAYKNTVQSFRAGNETDLDNVLQINNVFLNVNKGAVAPNEDLQKAFPGMTRDQIVLEILRKGDIQVGEKERAHELERMSKEVVEIVAGRLVDPKTKRVYTTGMIEKALDQLSSQGGQAGRAAGKAEGGGGGGNSTRSQSREQSQSHGEAQTDREDTPSTTTAPSASESAVARPVWKGVNLTRSAKSQALEAMKALIAHQPIPVARARMRLRITCATSVLKQSVKAAKPADGEESSAPATGTVKDRILSWVEHVESQDVAGEDWECVCFVEPGSFKPLTEFLGTQTKGRARAEVLDTAVTHEDE